jgi:YceI-like domain
MRVNASWKQPRCALPAPSGVRLGLRAALRAGAVLLLVMVAGCPLRPQLPAPAPAVSPTVAPASVAPHIGTPYDVVPDASLVVILVYRAGALASAGHNHVIASHDAGGTLYVPADRLLGSFELHVPVATLTVDEAALRSQQGGGDFAAEVSEGAKEGTRRNMLGPALLDAAHYPEIVLRAVRLEPPAAGTERAAANAGSIVAQVQSTVRDAVRTFAVPVHYSLGGGTLLACGELTLRQSELGLTPFSALLGALQVQDEMRISFRISARAAQLSAGPAPPAAHPPDTPCAAPRP